MGELKPCPFCGNEAEYSEESRFHIYWVYCPGCGAASGYRNTEAEAIAAWNARAERTCRNVHKEWEKTNIGETSFCCSECGAHYVDAECYYAGLSDANGGFLRTNYCPNCGSRVVE